MSRFYERMSMAVLAQHAATEHEQHTDEAARVFVERLVDLELERRLVLRHNNPGYSKVSPTALLGEPLNEGGFKGSREVRGDVTSSDWHDMARDAMSRLSPRQYAAALIRMAKDDHKATGKWAKTYDDIAGDIGAYLDILGFTGSSKMAIKYENGRAIRRSALMARVELVLLAKDGVI